MNLLLIYLLVGINYGEASNILDRAIQHSDYKVSLVNDSSAQVVQLKKPT